MARKKRTDNRGRVLRTGESQNKDGRYCFKWTDGTGKRNTTELWKVVMRIVLHLQKAVRANVTFH